MSDNRAIRRRSLLKSGVAAAASCFLPGGLHSNIAGLSGETRALGREIPEMKFENGINYY